MPLCFAVPPGEHACVLWVDSGCGGFFAIPYAPRRLRDPNAVCSEKAKTIPPLTHLRHGCAFRVVVVVVVVLPRFNHGRGQEHRRHTANDQRRGRSESKAEPLDANQIRAAPYILKSLEAAGRNWHDDVRTVLANSENKA
jgi:hypothetical protein